MGGRCPWADAAGPELPVCVCQCMCLNMCVHTRVPHVHVHTDARMHTACLRACLGRNVVAGTICWTLGAGEGHRLGGSHQAPENQFSRDTTLPAEPRGWAGLVVSYPFF